MKRLASLAEINKEFELKLDENGFCQKDLDEYRFLTLQSYRTAAALAAGTLGCLKNENESQRQTVEGVLAECAAVINDGSVYLSPGAGDLENSKLLEEAVQNARQAVAHAGNLFNNQVISLPEEIREHVLRARDFCDNTLNSTSMFS